MTLIVAGERSGVGKTTVTLALLAYLSRRSTRVQSFKVGPDYIDPMFHEHVTGRPCRNLDPVLTSETYVQKCFVSHTQTADYGLIEGVMGLFDGAAGAADWASTAHIARLLALPVLLVLDCRHLSHSVAAIAHGYQSFDLRLKIAGIVLNRVGSDRHLELLRTALEPLGLPILGTIHRQQGITIPDRHLGLVPTSELPGLSHLVDQLATIGETCFNWNQLLPLLKTTEADVSSSWSNSSQASGWLTVPLETEAKGNLQLAVARDQAFNFYYPDNLDLLRELGAELIFWSPLEDSSLPPGVQGLYFGGGFPEIFAEGLAENLSARQAVQTAIQAGLPTYAECGGLMYLCEQLTDFDHQSFPMVGVLPTVVKMTDHLTLGYRQAIALQDSPLLPTGAKLWGHEFHRSQLVTQPEAPLFQTSDYRSLQTQQQVEGWCSYQLHASYIHLHWGDRPDIPQRFLQYCQAWHPFDEHRTYAVEPSAPQK
jgi:cobyrinic acid a,c-diamide synthase